MALTMYLYSMLHCGKAGMGAANDCGNGKRLAII